MRKHGVTRRIRHRSHNRSTNKRKSEISKCEFIKSQSPPQEQKRDDRVSYTFQTCHHPQHPIPRTCLNIRWSEENVSVVMQVFHQPGWDKVDWNNKKSISLKRYLVLIKTCIKLDEYFSRFFEFLHVFNYNSIITHDTLPNVSGCNWSSAQLLGKCV